MLQLSHVHAASKSMYSTPTRLPTSHFYVTWPWALSVLCRQWRRLISCLQSVRRARLVNPPQSHETALDNVFVVVEKMIRYQLPFLCLRQGLLMQGIIMSLDITKTSKPADCSGPHNLTSPNFNPERKVRHRIIIYYEFGTLAVDEWAVTFSTARRGLGGASARSGPSWLYQM